jgi:hypothetical protein
MKTFQEFILEASCNGSPKGMDCPTHGTAKCPKVKSHKTVEAIATKHRLDVSFIEKQLKMGIPIEHEHTKDKALATDIALQHLDEIPDYYTRLKKMEASAKKEHKKFKDVKETVTIEDANGNTFLEIIDLIKPEKMKGVSEETASGDESLHDWFAKSSGTNPKTGRKVKGWPQIGGKFAGAPCARQPGQTTKPKCGSSKMAANMSDEEEDAAARRKRREDPNPDRSGQAKNVKTEEFVNEDACKEKVKSRYKIWPSAYASGALVKCRKVGAANWGNKTKKSNVDEGYTRIQSRGSTYSILLNWRGKYLSVQMFFPQFARPPKDQVTYEVRKIYPGAIVLSFNPSVKDPTKPLLFTGDENESRRH